MRAVRLLPRHPVALRLSVAALTLVLCFVVLEVAYRIIDPFPFFAPWEVGLDSTLTRYDPELGWVGTPGVREPLVTWNSRIWAENNSEGFRDVEHRKTPPYRDAVVFLGDSFTWGFEVESSDLFVNRLRSSLAGYEVFNLARNGYGTDQSLLVFRRWRYPGRLRLVVLMFTESDLADNNNAIRDGLEKPRFTLEGDELVLTNVPVPRVAKWDKKRNPREPGIGERLFALARRSHIVHLIWYLESMRAPRPSALAPEGEPIAVTRRLLQELRIEAERRGATLLVVAVPAKTQFQKEPTAEPYQRRIEDTCAALRIDYLDLAPAFEKATLRTYFRIGKHWNANGHAVAADALSAHLGTLIPLDAE